MEDRLEYINEVMDEVIKEQVETARFVADGIQREVEQALEKLESLRSSFNAIPEFEEVEWPHLPHRS